jgi:hypothetical protein
MSEGMTRIESAMAAAAHMKLKYPDCPLNVHRSALASMLSDISKDCDREGDQDAATTARKLVAMLESATTGDKHD